MYYLIKKNQKKLLAIFGVLLMVVFIIPPAAKYGATRADVTVAQMGKTPIHDSEMRVAKEEWSWLSRPIVEEPMSQGQRFPVSIDALVFTMIPRPSMQNQQAFYSWLFQYYFSRDTKQPGGRFGQAAGIASSIAEQIDKHPEMFFLLKSEATRDGIRIAPDSDEVNSYLQNALHVDQSEIGPESLARTSVQSMLMVAAELRRLMDAMKISEPVWQHVAAGYQEVRLEITPFSAADMLKSVPAPTTQQVEQQFDQFKDVPPHERTTGNPLGFGYQIPTHVKLQYVEIPFSQVVEAVTHNVRAPPLPGAPEDTTSDPHYLWEVAAASYYEAHKEDYKNTPPASQPATGPATTRPAVQTVTTQPATLPAVASTLPAIKPFDEVKQQIIEKLAAGDAEQESRKIANELISRLNQDFQAIRTADPAAVQPSTQPSTQPAQASLPPTSQSTTATLEMLAHLEQIRADIEKKYHVAIGLHDIEHDWQTAGDLSKLPGIGTAEGPEGMSLAEYATSFSHPMMPGMTPLMVWQPSAPLSDGQQNAYVFRLTAAQPAHAPANMAPIAAQVSTDWKFAQAYNMARDAAEKLLASAKSVGLSQASRSAGVNLITTGAFQPRQSREVPGYPLEDPAANQALLAAAEDLLSKATPSDKRPDSLVMLPTFQRALVIELASVELSQPEWAAQSQITEMQREDRLQQLASEYFSYDSVVARTGYKPEEKPGQPG